jgi:hypothetical protein
MIQHGNWNQPETINRRRRLFAWIALLIGMLGPGILLVTDPNGWVTSLVLEHGLRFGKVMVQLLGVVFLGCGVATLWESARDFAFGIAAVLFALIFLADIIAIFQGIKVSALFVLYITVSWLYAEAAIGSAALREQHLELTPTEQAVVDRGN